MMTGSRPEGRCAAGRMRGLGGAGPEAEALRATSSARVGPWGAIDSGQHRRPPPPARCPSPPIINGPSLPSTSHPYVQHCYNLPPLRPQPRPRTHRPLRPPPELAGPVRTAQGPSRLPKSPPLWPVRVAYESSGRFDDLAPHGYSFPLPCRASTLSGAV